jgi:hypothetical protein
VTSAKVTRVACGVPLIALTFVGFPTQELQHGRAADRHLLLSAVPQQHILKRPHAGILRTLPRWRKLLHPK